MPACVTYFTHPYVPILGWEVKGRGAALRLSLPYRSLCQEALLVSWGRRCQGTDFSVWTQESVSLPFTWCLMASFCSSPSE